MNFEHFACVSLNLVAEFVKHYKAVYLI